MPRYVKIVALGLLLGAASLLYWLFVRSLFFQDPVRPVVSLWSLTTLLVFAGLTVALATLCALVTFAVNHNLTAYALLSAGNLPFFLAFQKPQPIVAGGFVIFLIGILLMRLRIASENRGRLQFSVENVLPQHLTLFSLTLPLLLAAIFYVSPAPKQLQYIKIPRDVFQRLIHPIEAAFAERQPDQLRRAIEKTLEALPANLKTEGQEALRKLSHPFTGAEKQASPYSEFSDALYNAMGRQLAYFESPSPRVQLYMALAIFFIVRLMLIPLGWVTIVLTMMLWNILTYVGFVKMNVVPAEQEVAEL